MAKLRDIRKRITAVTKTQKITSAMKMVAAAKLARATQAIVAARPYAERLRAVLASVAGGVDAGLHPLLEARETVRRLDVVTFTSDRGLCGAYNSSILKYAERLIQARRDDLASVSVVAVGRKAGEYFRRRRYAEVVRQWTGISTVRSEHAAEIGQYLTQRYRDGEADEVVLVYSEFHSPMTQRPRHEILLPLRPESGDEVGAYEIEPDAEQLLGLLVPQAVAFSIFRALLENQAGEHGARMTAMDNATSNTEELVRTLTIDLNKARQAAITAELLEIVSGAEAL